ncbi:regulatory protein RecX [Allorhizocola rhizosphaerae]|uniref:regulatory protein RecX n=1 Tax=Allorhizocola rhizosphaerae TaxID=1872709 RepID=UPI003CCC7DB7
MPRDKTRRGRPGQDEAGWSESRRDVARRGQVGGSAAYRDAARQNEAGWGDRRAGVTGPDGGRRGEARRDEVLRDEHEMAREICLRQLAVRPRTRAELAKALHKRGISDEVTDAVLNRYDEVGMIDDAAFAKAWVSSRHHGRGLASRALAQELRQRGVSQEHTDEALSGLDADTEAQTALALATRKLRTMRGEPEAVFRRLVGMLARKGYPAGVAVRAVKEALATRDAEVAELIDPDAYEDE